MGWWGEDGREALSRGFGFGSERFVEGEEAFHSGAIGVGIFVEMDFGDAVVVQADSLADGILRNFEPAIKIPP